MSVKPEKRSAVSSPWINPGSPLARTPMANAFKNYNQEYLRDGASSRQHDNAFTPVHEVKADDVSQTIIDAVAIRLVEEGVARMRICRGCMSKWQYL